MEMTYDGTMVMPKNFVTVDEEEMTYTNGGAHYQVFIPASICNDLSNIGYGAGAASVLLGLIPEVGPIIAASFAAAFGVLRSYYGVAANHNGMTLHIYTVGNTPVAWIPVINW